MRSVLFACACAVVACGPGGGAHPDGPPGSGDGPPGGGMLTPGGGITGGPIAGDLRVYVVAAGGPAPIAGATVLVGGKTATTDATGLASFTDVSGPQTITATAAGRTAATWIGAAGADVTIPLDPDPRPTLVAHVSGTIAGWDQLPSPSFGHYTLAVVLYSFDPDVSSPDNSIVQPTASDGTPLDTCVDDGSGGACAWQLTTRTGRQRHIATILDGNAHGTSDPSDDTYTLIGYAIGGQLTPTANQTVTGESLTMIAASTLQPITVGFPANPPGLGHVTAIPTYDDGIDGLLYYPLPQLAPGATSRKVPDGGEFANAGYNLIGLATPSATAAMPYSTSFGTGVLPTGGPSTLPAWLPAPSALSASNGTYTFTTASGPRPAYATFARSDGSIAWNVMILDGSTSFTLPTIPGDPLASGSFTMTITAADVPAFAPASFAVLDLPAKLARASGAQIVFTR